MTARRPAPRVKVTLAGTEFVVTIPPRECRACGGTGCAWNPAADAFDDRPCPACAGVGR